MKTRMNGKLSSLLHLGQPTLIISLPIALIVVIVFCLKDSSDEPLINSFRTLPVSFAVWWNCMSDLILNVALEPLKGVGNKGVIDRVSD
jgi:hypothetical protein